MIKNYFELNKAEKMDLLKLIASGEVTRTDINKETTFAVKKDDGFIVMLSRITAFEEGTEVNIIEIGEAREARKQWEKFSEEVERKYPEGVPVRYL